MTGNNNTYYKSSMYEDRGENTAQEIIIALAIAVISLLLAGVIISQFFRKSFKWQLLWFRK